MSTQAVVPQYLGRAKNKILAEALALFLGVFLITALAQIVIRLPWTPIPITGQTFGVALTALMWGRKRAMGVVGTYLVLGTMGLPIFAAVLDFGASSGYLIGMFVATIFVGELSDRGYARTWGQAFLSASVGSLCIFGFGLLVLSYFVPADALLVSGLLPFIPGDLFKNALASFIASRAAKVSE